MEDTSSKWPIQPQKQDKQVHEIVFKNKLEIKLDDDKLDQIFELLSSQNIKINKIMANTDQALSDLKEINEKLQKIGNESSKTLQKVIDLENAAANGDTPQPVLDAIAAVKAQVQIVDDLVPDAV